MRCEKDLRTIKEGGQQNWKSNLCIMLQNGQMTDFGEYYIKFRSNFPWI